MAYWIEIRCENRHVAPTNGGSRLIERCWSHDNEGAGELIGETDVVVSIADFESRAKKEGFVMSVDGWLCPFCAKQLNK